MSEWKWLESTEVLQRESFGHSPGELTGEAQAEYLRWNTLAAIVELSEFLQETSWKPWCTGDKGVVNHRAALVELVDTVHFLGNLILTCGGTDEIWEELYQAKQEKNRQRMASGTYDGRSSKCPACDADYNDEGVGCRPAVAGSDNANHDPYCAKHGGYVSGRQSTLEEQARISRG